MTNTHLITDAADPRVGVYLEIKERELARQGGRFIAEGEHLVRRLLASSYTTESVLLAQRRVAEIAPLIPRNIPVYIVTEQVLTKIIGFKFHSGVVACGLRGPARSLEEVLPANQASLRIVVCEDINNTENLGSIVRIATGFGVDAVLLGERCANPFFRRCVRVSMGALFHVPLVQSVNLLADLARLREIWQVDLVATVLADDAQPLTEAIASPRMAILLGGEAQGLTGQVIAACDRRITIPMKRGTDSLNVAVAAGIFLYQFCR